MSSWPKATSVPESSAIRRRSRCASGTPRVWMPTSATLPRSAFPSTISCAIRVIAFAIASASRTVVPAEVCALNARSGRDSPSTPFRPHGTGLKGYCDRCGSLHGCPDGNRDEPLDAVVDPLGQLALSAFEAGVVLLIGDQVEGRDVLAADPLERGLARQRARLREPRHPHLGEPRELRGQLVGGREARAVGSLHRREELVQPELVEVGRLEGGDREATARLEDAGG